jgi:hypothetical protein
VFWLNLVKMAVFAVVAAEGVGKEWALVSANTVSTYVVTELDCDHLLDSDARAASN